MSDREAPNKMERGSRKYREWIHNDSKKSDTYGNLPFTFSKPKKFKAVNVHLECSACGHHMYVTEQTIVVICSSCDELIRISKE